MFKPLSSFGLKSKDLTQLKLNPSYIPLFTRNPERVKL